MTQTQAPRADVAPPPTPLEASTPSRANKTFAGLSTGSAVVILIVLAAVATFLLAEAWPAITDQATLNKNVSWIRPDQGESLLRCGSAAEVGPVPPSDAAVAAEIRVRSGHAGPGGELGGARPAPWWREVGGRTRRAEALRAGQHRT